jgi:hypothetical protein
MARCKNWFDSKKEAQEALKERKNLNHHMLQVGDSYFVGKDFQIAKIFSEYDNVKVLGENQESLLKIAKASLKVHIPRKVERPTASSKRGRPPTKKRGRPPTKKRGRPPTKSNTSAKRGRPPVKSAKAIKALKS